MEWGNVLAAAIGALAVAFGQWLTRQLSTRDIRNAIAAEIHPILVDLNFFIMRSMDQDAPDSSELVARFLGEPRTLEAFEYYSKDQRDRLLRLPEWSLLGKWVDVLNKIADQPDDALFRAVALFQRLRDKPLANCLSRDSRRFVESVTQRPEVVKFWLDQLNQRAAQS